MNFPYIVDRINIDHPYVGSLTRLTFERAVNRELLFAFPYSSFTFDYGGMLIEQSDTTFQVPNTFLHPPRSCPFYYSKHAGGLYYVFRLKPSTFSKITKKSLLNLSVYSHYLDGRRVFSDLYKAFKDVNDLEVIGNLFCERFDDQFRIELTEIDTLTDAIFAAKGIISTRDVYRLSSQSQTEINTMFEEGLGMNVKDYIELVRFYFFFVDLKHPGTNIEELYSEYNYFNFSEFTSGLKKYTGLAVEDFPGKNLYLLQDLFSKKNNN